MLWGIILENNGKKGVQKGGPQKHQMLIEYWYQNEKNGKKQKSLLQNNRFRGCMKYKRN